MSIIHFVVFESISTRKIIYSLSGQAVIIWLSERFLRRRHTLAPFVICMLAKTSLFYVFDYFSLLHPAVNMNSDLTVRICISLLNMITTALFLWTYEGNDGKSGPTILFVEVCTGIITFHLLIVVNIIEKRPVATEVAGTLHPLDFLIPVLIGAIWRLTDRRLDSLANRYRTWIPRRQWLLWFLFFIFWFSGNILTDGTEFASGNTALHYLFYYFWVVVVMGFVALWLWYQSKREKQRLSDMQKQLQLCETYETILERNTELSRKMTEDINIQVKRFEKQLSCLGGEQNIQIQCFLKQLKTDTQQLLSDGIFSGNIGIDAILYKWKQDIENRGGMVEIKCGGISAEGNKTLSLLPQILDMICEEWIDQHFAGQIENADSEENIWDETNLPLGLDMVFRLSITEIKKQLLISANLSGKWRLFIQRKKRCSNICRTAAACIIVRTDLWMRSKVLSIGEGFKLRKNER